MRIRTLVALGIGVAAGAAATYLLDPAHGQDRRASARSRAAARARSEGAELGEQVLQQARHMARAAISGFSEGAAPTNGH